MQDENTAGKRKALAVAVITSDPAFLGETLAALEDVAATTSLDADLAPPAPGAPPNALHEEARSLARRYLERSGWTPAITIVQAPSLEAAAARLSALAGRTDPGPLGMLYIDGASTGLEGDPKLEEHVEAFHERLAAAGVAAIRSPYAVIVHRRTPRWSGGANLLADRYLERLLAPDRGTLRTEQLAALMDFVERTFDRPRNHKAALRDHATTLGDEVVRFLSDRRGSDWLLFYYTGSSVSPLIDHLERTAGEHGVLAIRAANEHGLACGALANHLLHGRPSLFVVGTAMMDEMRGTLANLRSAGAQGFILCPEADEGSWFTFQGTITADEDMRAVLAARRIPHVYLESPDTLPERLEEAFRLYEEARGPVVLLMTQGVLDAKGPLPRPLVYPPRSSAKPATVELSAPQKDGVAAALAILNRERVRVLWQASRMDAEEEALVHEIAERAGVALVDTLGHPGPSHRGGKRVPGYLGTLGLYGFNQPWFAFLHEGGKLLPRAEQCLFFLKSKVGQRTTNFTPGRRGGIRMVQLTRRPDHVAPDVDLALVMDAKDFLLAVRDGLDVDPEVRRHRVAAIQAALAARPPALDLASRVPTQPMSPNYFFRELGALFERMIAEDGYTYTGVFDVGRCSVSATRSVPRTGRGWSGWYGRALMGDAPAALPALAVTEPGDVVAFVGDGGRSIVADPLPALLENAEAHPSRFDKSVTIFYFSNGTFSGIRTYRERLSSKWGGRQMRTFDILQPDADQQLGPLRFVRRTLGGGAGFDGELVRDALLARRRVNVITVLLGHNNDDDGFTLVSAGWQRDAAGG
jgi:thiamine pyrophosphate-dependent acetolactate synthase large subunit-like protein